MGTMFVEVPHRYETRLSGQSRYYAGDPVQVPVLLIEYRKEGDRYIPFSVITPWDTWDVEWCKRDSQTYYHNVGSGMWMPWREFNNGTVRTCNGGGKDPELKKTSRTGQRVEFFGKTRWHPGKFVNPNAGVPVWLDPRVNVCTEWKSDADPGTPVKRPEAYLLARGYKPIAEPLDLGDGITNPFETDDYLSFGDTSCEYCRVCDDWLPSTDNWSGELCDHLRWCEKHSQWTGRGLDKSERCCRGSNAA